MSWSTHSRETYILITWYFIHIDIENVICKNYWWSLPLSHDSNLCLLFTSRYRKYNLFNQRTFDSTKEPELSTFKTDFGVIFGMFICFDIMFAEPSVLLVREKQATDIIFSTAWFPELPFLTGKLIMQILVGTYIYSQVKLVYLWHVHWL